MSPNIPQIRPILQPNIRKNKKSTTWKFHYHEIICNIWDAFVDFFIFLSPHCRHSYLHLEEIRNFLLFSIFLKWISAFFALAKYLPTKQYFLSSENLSWIKYAYGILFYFFLNFYVCDKCGFVQKSCAHVEVKSFSNMQIWFCLFYRFFLVFCRSYFGDWSVCWPWSAVNWSADSHNFSAIFTMLEPFYSNESQF